MEGSVIRTASSRVMELKGFHLFLRGKSNEEMREK
jgi:hypothetical protein